MDKLYFYKPSNIAGIKGNVFVNSDYKSLKSNTIKGNTHITTLAENKKSFLLQDNLKERRKLENSSTR